MTKTRYSPSKPVSGSPPRSAASTRSSFQFYEVRRKEGKVKDAHLEGCKTGLTSRYDTVTVHDNSSYVWLSNTVNPVHTLVCRVVSSSRFVPLFRIAIMVMVLLVHRSREMEAKSQSCWRSVAHCAKSVHTSSILWRGKNVYVAERKCWNLGCFHGFRFIDRPRAIFRISQMMVPTVNCTDRFSDFRLSPILNFLSSPFRVIGRVSCDSFTDALLAQ